LHGYYDWKQDDPDDNRLKDPEECESPEILSSPVKSFVFADFQNSNKKISGESQAPQDDATAKNP
jgi:hypothetical protein